MELAPYLAELEEEMRACLIPPSRLMEPFYGMMAYHLGWLDRDFRPVETRRGKRFRPLLCLLACEAQGGRREQALPAAAAIELVHNFSLIHDDIEDNSPTRRHRETVWHIWGVAHGINVGDGMLILSHLALRALPERGVPEAKAWTVLRLLDETCLQLCQGQYLDLAFEERMDVSLEEYLAMIGGKTAALIAASAEIGAILATDDSRAIAAWRTFGWELGMAFQVVDDILGIWGEPSVTGKPTASDILSRKKTLPILYAIQRQKVDRSAEGCKLEEIYRQPTLSEADVGVVLRILDELGARSYAQGQAEAHTSRALGALDSLDLHNPAAQELRRMASSLLDRSA